MSRLASAARDRCLELERVIAGRFRSGSLGLDDAVKLLDELLIYARPASVHAFNKILTAVSRAGGRRSSTSALVISLYNRMARASPNKVAPNLHTYSIIISSFCSIGHLEFSFAAFGLILKDRLEGQCHSHQSASQRSL
ncbi:unnamed protein product [Urochloa humidicola]